MKRVSLFLLVMFLVSHYAYAQFNTVSFNASGKANESLKVTSEPPHGPLNLAVGNVVAEVPANTELRIIEKRSYPGFGPAHVWYRVEVPSNSNTGSKVTGWAYGGEEGDQRQIIQVDNPK